MTRAFKAADGRWVRTEVTGEQALRAAGRWALYIIAEVGMALLCAWAIFGRAGA